MSVNELWNNYTCVYIYGKNNFEIKEKKKNYCIIKFLFSFSFFVLLMIWYSEIVLNLFSGNTWWLCYE